MPTKYQRHLTALINAHLLKPYNLRSRCKQLPLRLQELFLLLVEPRTQQGDGATSVSEAGHHRLERVLRLRQESPRLSQLGSGGSDRKRPFPTTAAGT